MSHATVHIVPVLKDNYAYIMAADTNEAVIIDPGQPSPIVAAITHHGLKPVAILNTHHHADHVAGNAELMQLYGIPVIGPRAEQAWIPSLSQSVSGGDMITLAAMNFHVIATPGHTKGHIVFYNADHNVLFSGDTLFSLGCGRLMEDDAIAMFSSLQILKQLPPQTKIYCGHEYTENNAAFAASLSPHDEALNSKIREIRQLRLNNQPTVPSILSQELELNPFLKASSAGEFAHFRALKDAF